MAGKEISRSTVKRKDGASMTKPQSMTFGVRADSRRFASERNVSTKARSSRSPAPGGRVTRSDPSGRM